MGGAAKGADVDVSKREKVVAPLPATLEPEGGAVVRHAAAYLFGVDTIHECPEAEARGDDESFKSQEKDFPEVDERRG